MKAELDFADDEEFGRSSYMFIPFTLRYGAAFSHVHDLEFKPISTIKVEIKITKCRVNPRL